jgi:DNA polymerase I
MRTLNQLKPKIQEILLNNREKIELSKYLVTIKQDVPLEVNFEKLKAGEMNTESVKALFEELEFKTLMQRLIPVKHPLRKMPYRACFLATLLPRQKPKK